MSTEAPATPEIGVGDYQYGFHYGTEDYVFRGQKGLNRDVVQQISAMKREPQWMRDFRLEALDLFFQKPMPHWPLICWLTKKSVPSTRNYSISAETMWAVSPKPVALS